LTDGESLISEAEASHVCKTSGRNNKSGRTRIRDNLSARDKRPAYVFGEAPRSSRAQGKPGLAGEREVIHSGAQRGASSGIAISLHNSAHSASSQRILSVSGISDDDWDCETPSRYLMATPPNTRSSSRSDNRKAAPELTQRTNALGAHGRMHNPELLQGHNDNNDIVVSRIDILEGKIASLVTTIEGIAETANTLRDIVKQISDVHRSATAHTTLQSSCTMPIESGGPSTNGNSSSRRSQCLNEKRENRKAYYNPVDSNHGAALVRSGISAKTSKYPAGRCKPRTGVKERAEHYAYNENATQAHPTTARYHMNRARRREVTNFDESSQSGEEYLSENRMSRNDQGAINNPTHEHSGISRNVYNGHTQYDENRPSVRRMRGQSSQDDHAPNELHYPTTKHNNDHSQRIAGHRKHPHSRSRSRSTSVEPSDRNARAHRLLPEKFNGTGSVETFLAHFESCASYNQWGERDRVAHLRWCLTGPAAQVLWDVGPTEHVTYDALANKVLQRFGNAGQEEKYQAQLRGRKRKRDEPLQSLYQDIRRLMSLAYPGESSHFSELIAKDFFLSALDDTRLEFRCREHEPKDLDEALRTAMRLEQYEKALQPSSNVQRNRRVEACDAVIPSHWKSDIERQITELRRRLDNSKAAKRKVKQLVKPPNAPVSAGAQDGHMNLGHAYYGTPRKPEFTCYNCGGPNHIARNCPLLHEPMHVLKDTSTDGPSQSLSPTPEKQTQSAIVNRRLRKNSVKRSLFNSAEPNLSNIVACSTQTVRHAVPYVAQHLCNGIILRANRREQNPLCHRPTY